MHSEPSPADGELRVLIADDHRLFADALRVLLLEDERIDVVGIARDGHEAFELASELQPDIVVMDVNMPVVDGLEATRLIHEAGLPTRVLLLTGSDEPLAATDAREAGADGFLQKAQDAEALRSTFFEVASLASVLGGAAR